MKYRDLASKVNGNYEKADTICVLGRMGEQENGSFPTSLDKDLTIGEMQVQYYETDWVLQKEVWQMQSI